MAPLPVADPNLNVVINPSSTYSCLAFYPHLNPPPTTDPVEVSKQWTGKPSIPPATLMPPQLPLSNGLKLKSPVPETETSLEISDPEATDEFVKFVPHRWDNNQKRPGIILLRSPSVAAIPTLLTYKFIQSKIRNVPQQRWIGRRWANTVFRTSRSFRWSFSSSWSLCL